MNTVMQACWFKWSIFPLSSRPSNYLWWEGSCCRKTFLKPVCRWSTVCEKVCNLSAVLDRVGRENWKKVLNKALHILLSILPVSPFAKVSGDDDDGRAFAVLSSRGDSLRELDSASWIISMASVWSICLKAVMSSWTVPPETWKSRHQMLSIIQAD